MPSVFAQARWGTALRLLAAALPWLCQPAWADAPEVGRVTFVTGEARLVGASGETIGAGLKAGDVIRAGQSIDTGEAGHVYIKFVDDAFLSIRPRSHLLVEAYDYDPASPGVSRVKYKLDTGTARSITGKAGQANKSGFRFNTPVAAIGIRGTDFVVQTTAEVTRAAINSGLIAVSGFSSDCRPEGLGPCGNGVAELGARPGASNNHYLEVRSNQVQPILVPVAPGSDSFGPRGRPGGAEEGKLPSSTSPEGRGPASGSGQSAGAGAASGGTGGSASAAAPTPGGAGAGNGASVGSAASSNSNVNASASAVEVVSTGVVRDLTAVIETPVPAKVAWGRWAVYEGGRADRPSVTSLLASPDFALAVVNPGFAVFRDAGNLVLPQTGQFSFRMVDSEAYLLSGKQLSPAEVHNGKLDMDFLNKSFATSFQLAAASLSAPIAMEARGAINPSGTFFGATGSMDVTGTLSTDASQAGYAFRSVLDSTRTALGAVRWVR